jgi:hypothetical protein
MAVSHLRVTFHGALSRIPRPHRRRRAEYVAALMEEVLNSDAFRSRVLAADLEDMRRVGGESQIHTQDELLTLIESGRELSTHAADGEVDLVIRLRHGEAGSHIGWTDAEKGLRIEMRKRWFDMLTDEELVGNWTHEWMHQLGFIHDQGPTRRRLLSVPYVVGDIAEEVAEAVHHEG